MATHGLLSSDAPRLIEDSPIDEVSFVLYFTIENSNILQNTTFSPCFNKHHVRNPEQISMRFSLLYFMESWATSRCCLITIGQGEQKFSVDKKNQIIMSLLKQYKQSIILTGSVVESWFQAPVQKSVCSNSTTVKAFLYCFL